MITEFKCRILLVPLLALSFVLWSCSDASSTDIETPNERLNV